MLYRLVLSIELGTVQTWTGRVDPAWKFKYTTAARVNYIVFEKSETFNRQGTGFHKLDVDIFILIITCSKFLVPSKMEIILNYKFLSKH